MTPDQKKLYNIWRGIKFFWATGGPVDTKKMPRASSNNAEEVLAFKLRQSAISKHKAAIQKHLNISDA
jgi:hypothetical protein